MPAMSSQGRALACGSPGMVLASAPHPRRRTVRSSVRILIPVSALLLSTFTPSQTRQFQAEAHRGPTLFLTGSSLSVACGDVDGDGDLDCLVSRADTWFRRTDVLLYRRQAGTWQQSARASVQGVSNYIPRIEVKVADLDGDADLDVVAVVTGESAGAITRILCFRNDGGGSYWIPSLNFMNAPVCVASYRECDPERTPRTNRSRTTTDAGAKTGGCELRLRKPSTRAGREIRSRFCRHAHATTAALAQSRRGRPRPPTERCDLSAPPSPSSLPATALQRRIAPFGGPILTGSPRSRGWGRGRRIARPS